MSLILSIETATEVCSVALSEGNQVLSQRNVDDGMRHSSVLTSLISEVLKTSSRALKDLSAIALSNGPGSYTGLRVGASTAKALCYGLDIPLISISTLKSLIQPYPQDGVIISTLDARRMEAYAEIYQNGQILKATHSIIWDEEKVNEIASSYSDVIICGTGIIKGKKLFEPFTKIKVLPNRCAAALLVPLAIEKYAAQDFVDLAYHTPFYYKSPNITTSKKNFI